MPGALDGWREWLEETHSTGFELRRHFFLRFFDSELVSTPGQWRVVAAGVIAMLLSFSMPYAQAYFHKYRELQELPTPDQYRLAVLADGLFLITFSMLLAGLFTTVLWPSLFPGLRDYLALAGLPVRMRQVFVAKFTALSAFAGVFIVATTFMPSIVLPAVMQGRYARDLGLMTPAIFLSCSLGALFVFLSLVALQGVLLNLLTVRQFPRVSLAIQGLLLMVLLCALPLVFSIPSLQASMNQRPDWIMWVPPVWFLGVHQAILANFDPFAVRMAWLGLAAVVAAGAGAAGTYLWSYRRHRARVLETPGIARQSDGAVWVSAGAERFVPEPHELAVFAFIGKTLSRSRQHRLVLTGFAALAVAIIFESFVSLVLSRGFRGFSTAGPALRQAAVSAPLALSLFVLAGYRYLFRLPVELRANWVFRVTEQGNRRMFLQAVERFLACWAVGPVALATLPLEMRLLGPGPGAAVTVLALLPSLVLMECLLIRFEKIPFTSSYLPGRRPLIETVVIYGLSVSLYVFLLGALVSWAIQFRGATLMLFGVLLGLWIKLRRARLEDWEMGKLEFEELPEPAVQTLSIERD